jgi:dolichol-phosphate mannosyltransferase
MSTPQRFALIVPTLNEAGNIKSLLDRAVPALAPALLPWEILVVDDESVDGTPDIVREYARTNPRVRLTLRRGQSGLAGAITYGWEQTDADLLAVIDADLQHPPELLPELLREILGGADIAIASRYIRPHSMDGWSPVRQLISRASSLASKTVQNPRLKVADPMSGFFVVRRECIDGISFQPAGFKLLLEILAKGRIRSVKEVPYKFELRQHGKSKANFMTAVHYFSLLWRLAFRRSREEHKSPCS